MAACELPDAGIYKATGSTAGHTDKSQVASGPAAYSVSGRRPGPVPASPANRRPGRPMRRPKAPPWAAAPAPAEDRLSGARKGRAGRELPEVGPKGRPATWRPSSIDTAGRRLH